MASFIFLPPEKLRSRAITAARPAALQVEPLEQLKLNKRIIQGVITRPFGIGLPVLIYFPTNSS